MVLFSVSVEDFRVRGGSLRSGRNASTAVVAVCQTIFMNGGLYGGISQ